ncbi:hypothetical protein EST38_g9869 [Candolleomyces aberdarensis]|uniref:G domain-containing protein n=1 Tax=Candolleomyces aberdarensis TaxID=2316362 RepID=A0A4V1Q2R3_9AGAR|nr:hypothetical protein EST38_g9869 [Candolleomyces aberdarensis]
METSRKTVAVMGDTGAGKSSFINAVLGKAVAQVSSEACSCTTTVEGFNYELSERLAVSLVDSPGFDGYEKDSKDVKTHEQILRMLSDFLDKQPEKAKRFDGIVFLHSITTDGQLKSVVVVTTRWDEYYEGEALDEAEAAEQLLLESPGFMKDLGDEGVQFFRTGHFDDDLPQPSGDQYQSPLTIVEQLLCPEPDGADLEAQGLEGEADEEHDVGMEQEFEGEADEEHDVGMEQEFEGEADEEHDGAPEQEFEGEEDEEHDVGLEQEFEGEADEERDVGLEQKFEGEAGEEHEAGFDHDGVDAQKQSVEGREMQEFCDTNAPVSPNEPETPKQDLGGFKEDIWKALEDLRSATSDAKSERMEANEDLKQRIDKWEGLLSKFCAQSKAWEDRQKFLIAGQLVFGAKQVHELRKALETSQKEQDDLLAGWQTLQEHEHKALVLQTEKVALWEELNEVKSALAERKTRVKILKEEVCISGLRSQLEEMKNYQDLVNSSRLEIEDTRETLKKAREELETQARELGRLRAQVQAKTSESELDAQRIASLETELKEGKERLEELARESARLQDQVQAQTTEGERRDQQITSLKTELEEEKKKSEELAQESTRLRDQLQAKTTESELRAQWSPSAETEFEGWERDQAQESDVVPEGQGMKKTTTLEQEPNSFHNATQQPPTASPPPKPNHPAINALRIRMPLKLVPVGFSAFSPSQFAPTSPQFPSPQLFNPPFRKLRLWIATPPPSPGRPTSGLGSPYSPLSSYPFYNDYGNVDPSSSPLHLPD